MSQVTASGSGPSEPLPASPAPRHAGKRYTSDTIHVTFDGSRCIHAAECVRGLPAVFDTKRRPWILPSAATADAIAVVVERCPTGALHYERLDGQPEELADDHNTIEVCANGPLYVRGRLRILNADGELALQDVRVALCRCGQSQNKPFCDNAHIAGRFVDPGIVEASTREPAAEHGELTIAVRPKGPLKLSGEFEVISADGQTVHSSDGAILCRCGGSAGKPFCDLTHRSNGFQG